MTFELFEQGPGVYLPVLVVSLLITMAAYSAYPLLYAYCQNEPITAKKFRRRCYLGNLVPMLFFFLFNGGSSGVPYILWTSVFSAVGKNILDRRNLLEDSDDFVSDQPETPIIDTKLENEDELQQETIVATDPVKPTKGKQRYCKFCGSSIDRDTKKCTGCGKQYFRLPSARKNGRAYKIALFISFLIIAFCIFSNCKYQYQNTQLTTKIVELEGTVQTLQEQQVSDQQLIDKYRKSNAKNSAKVYDLSLENEKMKPIYNYCKKHYVATEERRRQYHDLDCFAISDYGVSGLYTESAAKSRGYSKCWCRNW